MSEVRALLRSGERDPAAALVHRLRGVAANLGAAEFAAKAFEFRTGAAHRGRRAPGGAPGRTGRRPGAPDGVGARAAGASPRRRCRSARRLSLPGLQGTGGDVRALDDRLANLLGFTSK
ncbi:hypothetical protein LP419_01365 [Massilia sp. H-1]|nr:hypothetical protein LP419_01365 [Massilia sp. H-1]